MIVSIVSEGQNVGHAGMMFERLKRLHETMRARGASEAAIARLPKLPVIPEPLPPLPVVLATRANGTHAAKNFVPVTRAPKHHSPKAEEYRSLCLATRTQRQKEVGSRILAALSHLASVGVYELQAGNQTKHVARVRWIGMLALAKHAGMGTGMAAATFGRERTAFTNARKQVPKLLREHPHLRQISDGIDQLFAGVKL